MADPAQDITEKRPAKTVTDPLPFILHRIMRFGNLVTYSRNLVDAIIG